MADFLTAAEKASLRDRVEWNLSAPIGMEPFVVLILAIMAEVALDYGALAEEEEKAGRLL